MYFDKSFGNWLPDEPEDKLLGTCENCGDCIYENYDRLEFEGMLFCDKDCLFRHLGVKEVD